MHLPTKHIPHSTQWENILSEYTTTKFISILEADGKDTVLNHYTTEKLSYDINDLFYEGSVISPSTYPNTNGYDSYGNATVYNGLRIEILSIGENGDVKIGLSCEEENETIRIESISQQPAVIPYVTDRISEIPYDTEKIVITHDKDISSFDTSKIKVYSGFREFTEYGTDIQGKNLIITFDETLSSNCDYRIVISCGAVSADGGSVKNNYNSIFSFVTEKQ